MSTSPAPEEDEDAVLARGLQAIAQLLTPQQAPAEARVPTPGRTRLDERRQKVQARLSDARSARRDGHTKTTDRIVMDVPLGCISGTRIENIRLQEDEIALTALCDSLETDGQLQPVILMRHPTRIDHFYMVAGNRRFKAASMLGWPTIKATICAADTSDQELYFLNAIENAQRFKISDYELACRAQLMSARFGTTLADYARRLGRTPARIQNLVRYLEVLPQDITEAWRSGDALLNDRLLQTLSDMPHDEASEYWAGWKARCAKAPTAGRRDPSRPRRSMSRPTASAGTRAWIAINRNSDLDERTKDLLLKTADYFLGRSPNIPGLFDPKNR